MKKLFVYLFLLSSIGYAQHWGEFKYNGVVKLGEGRLADSYSAVLWGIPSGNSWEMACESQPATIHGVRFSKPTHCVKTSVMPTVGWLSSLAVAGIATYVTLGTAGPALGALVATTNYLINLSDIGALNIWGIFYIERGRRISIPHSGKCLDVEGASRDNVSIIQYKCTNQHNQQFMLKPLDQGYYAIIARHSGKCLDVKNGSRNNGGMIQQYPCNFNQWNQQFKINTQGNGAIINRNSGKCLDISGGDKSDGVKLIQWDCHRSSNQIFSVD